MKRAAVVVVTACVLAPIVIVGGIAIALARATSPATGNGAGTILSIDGVDPQVLTVVSETVVATLNQHPGCDADALIVLAHMSIEWPPGLQGLGRSDTPMAPNGDFYPIIQAYAPVSGADTDNGRYDASATAEYAAGPLQQINAFKSTYGTDASGDGDINQNNLADATATSTNHACQTQQQTGLSLQTPQGRRYEAGHYMLPAAPTSPATADYANLIEDAYQRLRAAATYAPGPHSAGTHALPVDPALIKDPAVLVAPHHHGNAWDYPTPVGTTIYASAGGTVTTAGYAGNCGNGVTIDADDGARYTYCHGSQILVNAGQRVETGQPILLSGNTGNSTGPHLHLQINYHGNNICPQPLLRDWYQGQDTHPASAPSTGCTR